MGRRKGQRRNKVAGKGKAYENALALTARAYPALSGGAPVAIVLEGATCWSSPEYL